MKILIIGPQASGKGTQAKILSKNLHVPHISTGDLLRNTKGELKEEIDSYINRGNLIPDKLMTKILKKRIEKPDCQKGFILEGYPRNLKQAEELDKITKIDKVIEIHVSDEESMKRLSSRLYCKNCNEVYSTAHKPSKKEGICDACRSELSRREDEYPGAIKKRLEIYHTQTQPLLEHYASIKINGEQSIEKVSGDIIKKL